MQTARNHKLAQPGNRRTGPVMLAAFILLAIAIGFIGSLPTSAQVDSKAVGVVRLGEQPARRTRRVVGCTDGYAEGLSRQLGAVWARTSRHGPTVRAMPFLTTSSYTITGLDQGVRYKSEGARPLRRSSR